MVNKVDKSNPIVEKIKFLFNDPVKKFAAITVLFSAILAQYELRMPFCIMPTYEQLSISTGKIKIKPPALRVGREFYLVINRNNEFFSCAYASINNTCLSDEVSLKYQGKIGKVWWFKDKCDNVRRLYQLEVDGGLIISYSNQIKEYRISKEGYFYQWTIMFFLFTTWFIKCQF